MRVVRADDAPPHALLLELTGQAAAAPLPADSREEVVRAAVRVRFVAFVQDLTRRMEAANAALRRDGCRLRVVDVSALPEPGLRPAYGYVFLGDCRECTEPLPILDCGRASARLVDSREVERVLAAIGDHAAWRADRGAALLELFEFQVRTYFLVHEIGEAVRIHTHLSDQPPDPQRNHELVHEDSALEAFRVSGLEVDAVTASDVWSTALKSDGARCSLKVRTDRFGRVKDVFALRVKLKPPR